MLDRSRSLSPAKTEADATRGRLIGRAGPGPRSRRKNGNPPWHTEYPRRFNSLGVSLEKTAFLDQRFGRRVSREVKIGSGPWVTTTYLYDGLNPVQETSQGATTNMLTGLGLDEYFMRSEPSGTMSLLTDALGSTIALTDLNGDIQTEYTYGPFGATTESGVLSSNPYRFTGRECVFSPSPAPPVSRTQRPPRPSGEEGDPPRLRRAPATHYHRLKKREREGVRVQEMSDFMRERYMMPRWTRFLSRDPMGFAAGSTNLYTYAGNSPTNFTDRLGLIAPNIGGGGGGGGPVKRSGVGGPCDGPCPSVGFVFPQVQGTLDKLRRQRGTKSGPTFALELRNPFLKPTPTPTPTLIPTPTTTPSPIPPQVIQFLIDMGILETPSPTPTPVEVPPPGPGNVLGGLGG